MYVLCGCSPIGLPRPVHRGALFFFSMPRMCPADPAFTANLLPRWNLEPICCPMPTMCGDKKPYRGKKAPSRYLEGACSAGVRRPPTASRLRGTARIVTR